jgi:hypothetical protein
MRCSIPSKILPSVKREEWGVTYLPQGDTSVGVFNRRNPSVGIDVDKRLLLVLLQPLHIQALEIIRQVQLFQDEHDLGWIRAHAFVAVELDGLDGRHGLLMRRKNFTSEPACEELGKRLLLILKGLGKK